MGRWLIVLLMLLTAFFVEAQGDDGMIRPPEENLLPETPHAWKIREATMPTPALLTGAVEFEIPVYTLEAEGISIPITLKYRSNGIKVEDDPYPCGFGWSLLPALSVTRIIRGRPDNYFPYYSTKATNPDAIGYEECFKCMCMDKAKYMEDFSPNIRWDAEHDIFMVHLPNKTLTVMYDRENERFWGVNCNEYVVEFSDESSGIKVTDPNGYIYNFDIIGEYFRNYLFIKEWLLRSVVAPSGKNLFAFSWGEREYHSGEEATFSGMVIPYDEGYQTGFGAQTCVTSNIDVHGVRDLTGITGCGVSAKFTYTALGYPNYRMLTQINVRDTNKKVNCLVNLDYADNDPSLLVGVTHSSDGKYTFAYDTRFTFPVVGERSYKGGPMQDWWGFYNARIPENSIDYVNPAISYFTLPKQQGGGKISGADRRVDTLALKSRILIQATLPTCGTIQWDYEAHRFSPLSTRGGFSCLEFTDNILSEGGGLRVKQVTMTDPVSNTIQKRMYEYGKNGDGRAVCKEAPVLSSFVSHRRVAGYFSNKGSDGFVHEYGEYEIERQSRINACRPGELPIWYSEVAEICEEGKTVSYFEALYDENEVRYRMYYDHPNEINTIFSQGPQLVKRETFKSEANSYIKVQTEDFDYEVTKLVPFTDLSIVRNKVQYQSDKTTPDFSDTWPFSFIGSPLTVDWDAHPTAINYSSSDVYDYTLYNITPQVERLRSKSTTLHTDNGDYITTQSYSYVDSTSLVRRVDYSSSEGKAHFLETEYVPEGAIGAKMRQFNIVGVPTKTTLTYGSSKIVARNSMYHNGKRMILADSVFVGRGNKLYNVGAYKHDKFGNIAEMRIADGRVITYLWGHDGLVPVYQILGKSIADLKPTYGENLLNGTNEDLDLWENSVSAQTTKVEWLPAVGPIAITAPTGVRTTFDYDDQGRLSKTAIDNYGVLSTNAYLINLEGKTYIDSRTRLDDSGTKIIRTIENYDGLGRPWISVVETDNTAVATLNEYDAMGRPSAVWQACPVDDVHPSAVEVQSAATQFYGDAKPYALTGYEASPRAMAESSLKAGAAWHNGNHCSTVRRTTNRASRRDHCPHFELNGGGIDYKGFYEAGSLMIEESTDEDGIKTQTFTDKRGKTVMVRRVNGSSFLDTRYIYDDFGDLRYVLPPNFANKSYSATELATADVYSYTYDDRGNVLTRRVPGRGTVKYRYDSAGRLIGEQDPLTAPNWQIHLYDKLGREVVHALVGWTDQQWNAFSAKPRAMIAGSSSNGSGYICSDYDISSFRQIFTVRRYNDKGQLSREYAGDLTTEYTYDALGRVSRSVEMYPADTLTTDFNYTYTGKVAKKTEAWSSAVPKTITNNSYDGADRLVKSVILRGLSNNSMTFSYDAVGRLVQQKAGDVISRAMAYDVHGWLKTVSTDIKNPAVFNDSSSIIFRSATSNAFDGLITPLPDIKVPLNGFTEELMYEKGKTPRYNGNISSRIFSEGRYDYTYDPYNRLISASYTDTSNKDRKHSATYFYDSTSKITSLLRTGITDRVGTTDVYGQHSDIYYSYTGSRLTSLGSGAAGTDYEGCTGLPVDGTWALGYDANGNLSYDESHNITSVSYNHLNQPTEICFADGSRIENRYTSDGRKWQATYVLPDSSRSVTKYLGNAIVRDGKFDMMRTPWGYFDGNSRPHYYVTDYQGNITHTVNASAEIEQAVSYYPDGEPWIEPTGKNPYLYGGKERISFAGLRQYDFGARMLNTSAGGHWWQVDPKCEDYTGLSPYCAMGGNPVMYTDPTGTLIRTKDNEGNYLYFRYDEEKDMWSFKYDNGNEYVGDNAFVSTLGVALNGLIKGGEIGAGLVEHFANSDKTLSFLEETGTNSETSANLKSNDISIKDYGATADTGNKLNNMMATIGHELAHFQLQEHPFLKKFTKWESNDGFKSKSDIFATHIENLIRAENGLKLRMDYDGIPLVNEVNNESLYYHPDGVTIFMRLPNGYKGYKYK